MRERQAAGHRDVPVGRDLCDDHLRPTTLVDFRGSNLSDPGSIPGISTNVLPAKAVRFSVKGANMKKLPPILIMICLFFITSCQTSTPTPEQSFLPTETLPASPTSVPASPTPEPTFTPEATPTPFPRHFIDQFDSSPAGWTILQAGNEAAPTISTENSTLRLQMDAPYTWLYALYSPFDYADVYIETEFVNSALTPASAGLICRYSETDGWLEYNVSTDGAYNVLYGQWLDTGVADYLPILDGVSGQDKQSGEVQQIGLNCSGITLRLYIDGVIIRSVDISSYELGAGKAGLTAASYGNTPVVVVFDSVTVSEALSP